MLRIALHSEGCVLPLRALPGSRVAGLRGVAHGALKVAVTQVAEKGKANKALLAVLADALHLRMSQLELLSGDTSRDKQVLIRGITPAELELRITAANPGNA